MSQPPYPYPPQYNPYGGYPPPTDPLAPARRAAVLMIILGALIAAYGLCNGAYIASATTESLTANPMMRSGGGAMPSMELVRTSGVVVSALTALYGACLVATGVATRRGGRGAIITGMVLTGLGLLGAGLVVLIGIAAAFVNPIAAILACVGVVPAVFMVVQFVWLVRGLRGSESLAAAQQQYQAQLWQSQQYAQQHGQVGYGYGAQVNAAPPAIPPPPPPGLGPIGGAADVARTPPPPPPSEG